MPASNLVPQKWHWTANWSCCILPGTLIGVIWFFVSWWMVIAKETTLFKKY